MSYYCVCGRQMVIIAVGDNDADDIRICRRCHKITAPGWKWG